MLLQDAKEQFIAFTENTRKLSPHSIKAYRKDLDSFIAIVGANLILNEVTRSTIHNFVNQSFSNGLSHATVKRRIACLKSMFKWLENESLVKNSPFRALDLKIRLPQRLPRNLSQSELSLLLRIARENVGLNKSSIYLLADFSLISKSSINHLNALLCAELLFTTGIRVGELAQIALSDLFLEDSYIHIKGKGQRERRVFIVDKSIHNLISSYLSLRRVVSPEHQTLIVNSRGRPATTQTIRIWLKKLSKRAGLDRHATPHMYRHSAATELLSSGVDISYVQRLLGHQSISTTQIYAHVSHRDVFRSVAKANIRQGVL